MFSLCAFGLLTSPSKFFVEPVVKRKVTEPPSGPLYWRLENFGEISQLARSIGQNGEHNRRSRACPRAWDASTLMSELGQTRTSLNGGAMTGFSSKADPISPGPYVS